MENQRNGEAPAVYDLPAYANEIKPFEASAAELCLALLSFIAAFLYSCYLLSFSFPDRGGYLAALSLILVFITEFLNRKSAPSKESIMLLACFLVCAAALSLNCIYERAPLFVYPYQHDRIWTPGQQFLFIHIFFVWYVMSRSGKLLDKVTDHLLPADVLDGAVIIPFGNIFLRIRTLIWGVKGLLNSKKSERKFPWMSVAAVIVSGILLVSAISLLMDADESFARIFQNIGDFFRFEPDELLCMELVLSIPVGAWLWGLMGGCFRYPEERLAERKSLILSFLETIKKVSGGVWTGIIAVFSVIYLVFFVIQGNYLFGAFFGRLPEGFIVSEYARRGFFELCKVMALNFLLLWMTTRTADKKTRDSKLFKGSCLLLLSESVLFSVISISKLALYISYFGITPLRLQSSWFAAVLLTGCLMWIYSLLTGKKVFRYWIYFGAVSLAVMAAL